MDSANSQPRQPETLFYYDSAIRGHSIVGMDITTVLDQRFVRIAAIYPESFRAKSGPEIANLIDNTPIEDRPNSVHSKLIRLSVPDGRISRFGDNHAMQALQAELGYHFFKTSEHDSSLRTIHESTDFGYPTTPRLDRAAQRAFPRSMIRLIERGGVGLVQPMDFFPGFVERNEVIIPGKQPYQIAEHASRQPIIYKSMGNKLVTRLQSEIGDYLAVAAHEDADPLADGHSQAVTEILHGSRMIMGLLLHKLEALNGEIANNLFETGRKVAASEEVKNETVARILKRFWESGGVTAAAGMMLNITQPILKEERDSFFLSAAKDIRENIRAADAGSSPLARAS